MTIDVTSKIEIARPRAVVADFSADPDNVPRWYVNIKSVEWKTPRPARAGSRIAFVAQFLGRRLVYTYEIVELVQGERLVMRTAEGPFPMETSYAWRDAGEGRTHMALRNRGAPTGFSRMVAPFVALAVRRSTDRDLLRLKRILEAAA
ncbi:MAG: ATPase [Mesorhizobium sp.]|uniref:SRPBCC family protein n=1 Tax=Mesorhizobium sp. TaxID=1871066 RepID=UPI000FE8B816|nr:SRPBCC family protein [Mesorhizobium sp.]RWH79267.1 MAG: ATPase [Mesorhizobium sp.]RWH81795.1 MAG: ATPase [Mesorhizobium sp.]RWH88061.1 MAG: ATPase [Mesorhizobium sp.]RWI01615.1 MAG: ATPase [Mesorhizobium sp.]RWI02062.1 MAG: ATPase [Mesorhizobium sp.]